MASTVVINPANCKVLNCFKIERSVKRYLLITIKRYPFSSENYTSIQLFKVDEETKEYSPQKYLTLKFQESNKIHLDDVYTNVVNVFDFSLDVCMPYHKYHKNDMDYFDFIFDVQYILKQIESRQSSFQALSSSYLLVLKTLYSTSKALEIATNSRHFLDGAISFFERSQRDSELPKWNT